ncbi:ABC transporter ATP-binding protein [Vibrio sp. PNB22_3_1]
MIHLDGVSKRFKTAKGTKLVLDNVTFTFPGGRDIAVMGANGAGKTTLLKLLARSDYPSSGRITTSVQTSWPLGLGGGFQGSMSGRENVQFVCRIYGAKNVAERMAFVQEFSGIGKNFDLPIKTYSSGMRSKYVFALSMAFDFQLYLIDEVMAVGDASFQAKCAEVLEAKRDISNIILVAHSDRKMREHCDYGVVVKDGRLTGYDDIEEALEIYAQL